MNRRGLAAAALLSAAAAVAAGLAAPAATAAASSAAPSAPASAARSAPASAKTAKSASGKGKAAKSSDPTITITTGGTRSATGAVGPVPGVEFTATGNSNGATGAPCITGATGSCTISITTTISQTYTIAATIVPPSWFANPTLGVGVAPLAAANTGTSYFTTGTIAAGAAAVFPVAMNTSAALTSRGSQLAFSRTDPREPKECGLNVALLFDLSSSITSAGALGTYLSAGQSFVTSLQGTPSNVAVYTFGTDAPATSAPGTTNNAPLTLTPVSTAAGANAVRAKISGLTVQGAQYTNWDAGLSEIANSGQRFDVVIVLTDGDPTRFGRPTGTALPGFTTATTRFIDVENGVFSANAVKATSGVSLDHPALLAVGIDVPSPASGLNLRAISGPGDFSTTTFAGLAAVLNGLARDMCLGSINVVKQVVPHGGTISEASPAAGWTFHSTAPAESRTTDATGAVTFETGTSTTPTTITETVHSGYTPLPEHTSCFNTVTEENVPIDHVTNGFTVAPDPTGIITCQVFNEAPPPSISIVKSAFPTHYGAPGEEITYTYVVTNTGGTVLHNVTVEDDTVEGPVTCEETTLAPGQSTTCTAPYIITEDDIERGHVTNQAEATGHPPTGPPVDDTDTETIHVHTGPEIQILKTAFPTEYAVAGELIRYTYEVVNTGNVILRNVTVTDSRLGPVTCPMTTLLPGESMTCHATHTTTLADVQAGHIPNAATATGHPPTGPPVTDTDTENVVSIHRPAIQIEKLATPATYSGSGQPVRFTYLVTNTGIVTLHAVTVTDSRLGAITCPHTTLAPGASMTCHGTYITTAADVKATHATNVATVRGRTAAGAEVSDHAEATIVGLPLVPVTG